MKNISDMKKMSLTLTRAPNGAKVRLSSIGKTVQSIGGLSKTGPDFGSPGT